MMAGFTTLGALPVDVLHREKENGMSFQFCLVQSKLDQRLAILATYKDSDEVWHSQTLNGGWSNTVLYWFRTSGELMKMIRTMSETSHDKHYMRMLQHIMEEYA
jgi:hypothetical protein